MGYIPFEAEAANLFFQLISNRYERASVIVASNKPFGWTKTFTDPRRCAAIVDRLTFNGTIIESGTESYHLAQTRAKQQAGR
ncbi:DNA replication protein DnaC [Streptacidiphilus sp. MAP12-33]